MSTAPTALAPAPARIAALDGLRGLAIAMVLVMHCYVIVPTVEGSVLHDGLKSACSLFFSGVDLFFILSGFLIGGILIDNRDSPSLLPAFYIRRFARIIPLYAILLLSFLACRQISSLTALNGGHYFTSPVPLWSYFVMGQNIAMSWVRDVGSYWITPTWSLGIEEQFYLLMPFVVGRITTRALAYVCVVSLIACPMLRIAALLLSGNSVAATFLLPMRADSLLAGLLCAIVVRNARILELLRQHRSLLFALLITLAAFLALLSARSFTAGSPLIVSAGDSVIVLFYSGLLLWVLAFPTDRLARTFSFRPLCGLGVISYFVYLFHQPVHMLMHWAARGLPPTHEDWRGGALTLLSLLATFLLGALSWHFLETPLLKLGRRWSYA